MSRIHQVLVGVLVLQLALGVALLWPRPAPAAAGALVFGLLKPEDITGLQIRDSAGASIKLSKQGANWVLPDSDNFPADGTRITPVLAKIAGLKTGRLVARTAASQKQLKVADDTYERRIEIQTAGGTNYVLYLGTAPSASSTHFRLASQTDTYLTADLTTYDLYPEASSWINTAYVSVATADVTGMTLQNANGTFVFAKDPQGAWTLADLAAGETANSSNITALVNAAGSLSMKAPLGKSEQPGYGLAQPAATITLVSKDTTQTIKIGTRDPGDGTNATYPLKSSASEYYVVANEWAVQNFAQYKRSDLVQLPPTPTPAPAPGAATSTPRP